LICCTVAAAGLLLLLLHRRPQLLLKIAAAGGGLGKCCLAGSQLLPLSLHLTPQVPQLSIICILKLSAQPAAALAAAAATAGALLVPLLLMCQPFAQLIGLCSYRIQLATQLAAFCRRRRASPGCRFSGVQGSCLCTLLSVLLPLLRGRQLGAQAGRAYTAADHQASIDDTAN
jgi:hypothetical protein